MTTNPYNSENSTNSSKINFYGKSNKPFTVWFIGNNQAVIDRATEIIYSSELNVRIEQNWSINTFFQLMQDSVVAVVDVNMPTSKRQKICNTFDRLQRLKKIPLVLLNSANVEIQIDSMQQGMKQSYYLSPFTFQNMLTSDFAGFLYSLAVDDM